MEETAIDVHGEAGFSILPLPPSDLSQIQRMVQRHWLSTIQKHHPEHSQVFESAGIQDYHLHSSLLPHGSIWSKLNRILPAADVTAIRDMEFFKVLKKNFGDFTISDEENVGHEEIYWRIVRPYQPQDIGPMHADSWFWDLGHGQTPPGTERVKVWIPLFCEPGANGLEVVPGSHLKTWKYHGEMKGTFVKPVFDEDRSTLNINLLATKPGDAVVFNDKLLHGGALNKGAKTRVSCEFTMFTAASARRVPRSA